MAPLLQADRSRRALMKQVTGAWAMQQHLDALWRSLFLASPAMQPFLSTAHDMLAASHRDDTELRAVDLQRALDMTLSDAEQGSVLPSSSVSGAQQPYWDHIADVDLLVTHTMLILDVKRYERPALIAPTADDQR